MDILITYLLIINALGFLLMRIDKQKAIRGRWRIPEATLLGAAFLGGSLGCMWGMYAVRHKTKHLKFSLGLPVIFAVQVLLLVFLVEKRI